MARVTTGTSGVARTMKTPRSAWANASLAAALAGIAVVAPVPAAQPIPGEAQVTDQRDMLDCEFSQQRGQMAWVDRSGGLWVADVDRTNGMFIPADGKGTLVDPKAMASSDIRIVGNGPEWIGTATGDQIVYTKFLAGVPKTRGSARLALAQQRRGGGWEAGFLAPANLPRAAPYPSHDPRDPFPRIGYVSPGGNHYWRNLYEPLSEERLEHYPSNQYYGPVRFVEGERGATMPRVVDGVSQVFYHDLDTGVETQLTFDGGQKDLQSMAWIWAAPDFGGARVMMTVADNIELRIYREDPGPSGWILVRSVRAPRGGMVKSPEYFVHDGASYVFFVASVPPATFPTQLFLANIDPGNPLLAQLTPDSPLRMRTDPEVFIADDGPWIYFNRQTIDLSGSQHCLSCNEGIFRSHTGLPPPQ